MNYLDQDMDPDVGEWDGANRSGGWINHLCLAPIHVLSWVLHGPLHPGHGPGSGNHDLAHGLVEVLGLEELPGLHVLTEWCRKDPRIPQTRSFKPFLQVRSPPLNKWTPTPPAVQALSRSAAPR